MCRILRGQPENTSTRQFITQNLDSQGRGEAAVADTGAGPAVAAEVAGRPTAVGLLQSAEGLQVPAVEGRGEASKLAGSEAQGQGQRVDGDACVVESITEFLPLGAFRKRTIWQRLHSNTVVKKVL